MEKMSFLQALMTHTYAYASSCVFFQALMTHTYAYAVPMQK
jgi:hypothetical protein